MEKLCQILGDMKNRMFVGFSRRLYEKMLQFSENILICFSLYASLTENGTKLTNIKKIRSRGTTSIFPTRNACFFRNIDEYQNVLLVKESESKNSKSNRTKKHIKEKRFGHVLSVAASGIKTPKGAKKMQWQPPSQHGRGKHSKLLPPTLQAPDP